jgi:hypothetical protein
MTKSKIYILNRKTVPFQRHYSLSSSEPVSADRGTVSATKAADCFSYGERFIATIPLHTVTTTTMVPNVFIIRKKNACSFGYKSQRGETKQKKRGGRTKKYKGEKRN